MDALILSNFSQNIAELNGLTAPNKLQYAERHGYAFENVEIDYGKQVEWLRIVKKRLKENDIVMTMGCDAIFTNYSRRIEDKISPGRIVLAKEEISWWPINNDVIIWHSSDSVVGVLEQLIKDASIWLKYPWLWQNHLWNLMQTNWHIHETVEVLEARELNSTFQPFIVQEARAVRIPGPSSWQLGDWIFHALDMSPQMRIETIKWALQFAGNGTYYPNAKIPVA